MSAIHAQVLDNRRVKKVLVQSDTLKVDSIGIVPNSLKIYDQNQQLISDSRIVIDFFKGTLVLPLKLRNSIIYISYRQLPQSFTRPYYHKDTAMILTSKGSPYLFTHSSPTYNSLFIKEGLIKNGSISRGISFGNNQDVIVNSNLNLQMAGKLSDNLYLMAAVSDNNIPLQPDGYSQQIQEFDKVFIKVYNDNIAFTAGDFELSSPTGYFMKFFKKAQGADLLVKKRIDKNITLTSQASGSISKGKYNRMTLLGSEGNQGPYRLYGAQNETYIIVLSGSENVYIDGKLLKRGQDNDYIVDYNTAELTFTTRQLITKDKRIVVEFQYSDKNYARYLIYSANELQFGKNRIWLNAYSEQDSKNQPVLQDLTDADKQILANAGDKAELAVVPGVDSITFSNNMVLYRKTDTLSAGKQYIVYVYSINPNDAFYKLSFSYVGEGKGNYQQIKSSANGKVYQWIAPINGILQGNYEPVTILTPPQKKQMLTIGTESLLDRKTKTFVELALSNYDMNTFSSIDKANDAGYALKTSIERKFYKNDSSASRFMSSLSYELTDKNFNPVEQYRPQEFDRDWNIKDISQKNTEHHLVAALSYAIKRNITAAYGYEFFERRNLFIGQKHNLQTNLTYKTFNLNGTGSIMNSTSGSTKTYFIRYHTEVSKTFSFVKLGIASETENNMWRKTGNDSLLANSFLYNQYEIFLVNPDSFKNKYKISYKNREDYLPSGKIMKQSAKAKDFSMGLDLLKNPARIIRTLFTYRNLQTDTTLTQQKNENTLLSRIESNLRFAKGFIVSSTFYETGSGVEAKKEYSYIEVAKGQGVYTWNDYNHNNIKELDEFEVSSFPDQATYIRVYTPTNSYMKTYTNSFSQMFNIRPENLWSGKKKLQKWISRFSDQVSYRIDRKTLPLDKWQNLNPFTASLNNDNLLSTNSNWRNVLGFNQTNPVYGLEYMYQNNSNKIMLVNGFDSRSQTQHGIKLRVNPLQDFTLNTEADAGTKNYTSQYFSNKDFNLALKSMSFAITYHAGLNTDVTGTLLYADKNNQSIEDAKEKSISIEVRNGKPDKGNIGLKLNYIHNTFNADENTSLAYEMLQGLRTGNNATWQLQYQKKLASGLELSLSYNGRFSEGDRPIHTANMQLRAYF
jgi:hypothetical protein